MDLNDLLALYEKYKLQHGVNAFRYISTLLEEAKVIHHRDWLRNPTRNRDHEQSWRAFKGKNLENLVLYMIRDAVEALGFGVVGGNRLERTEPKNLPDILNRVKRNLLLSFGTHGEFGYHLPDVDIVIYNPTSAHVVAVISSKVTLRERIAQTGYWKLKLLNDPLTRHIKVYFVTPDQDGTLTTKKPMKKGRAIVETDIDGSYVMTEEAIEESERVKSFDKFIQDLQALKTDHSR